LQGATGARAALANPSITAIITERLTQNTVALPTHITLEKIFFVILSLLSLRAGLGAPPVLMND
jgi:hypothetical protein